MLPPRLPLLCLLCVSLSQTGRSQPCFGNPNRSVDYACGVGFANKTGNPVQGDGTGPAPSPFLLQARCCDRIFCGLEHCDEGWELVPDACCGRQRIPPIGVAANNTICCQEVVALEDVVKDLAAAMAGELGDTFLMMLDVLPHLGPPSLCLSVSSCSSPALTVGACQARGCPASQACT